MKIFLSSKKTILLFLFVIFEINTNIHTSNITGHYSNGHNKLSLRKKVSKYLHALKKKGMSSLEKRKRNINTAYYNLRHPIRRYKRHYAIHQEGLENKIQKNIKSFEHHQDIKRKRFYKNAMIEKLQLKKERLNQRIKKAKLNPAVYKKRQKKQISAKLNEIQKRKNNFMVKKSMEIQKKNHVRGSPPSRYLKSRIKKKKNFDKSAQNTKTDHDDNMISMSERKTESPIERDLDDDKTKLVKPENKENKKSLVLTQQKIVPEISSKKNNTVQKLNENPDVIKIPRKLLSISQIAGPDPIDYHSNMVCKMVQAQAVRVAREIVSKQSNKMFTKLSNYILKGKLLINLTKVKINKAIQNRIKELLEPSHLGFTLQDVEALKSDFQDPLSESVDEAEDYITEETYSDFKGDVPKKDNTEWNLN